MKCINENIKCIEILLTDFLRVACIFSLSAIPMENNADVNFFGHNIPPSSKRHFSVLVAEYWASITSFCPAKITQVLCRIMLVSFSTNSVSETLKKKQKRAARPFFGCR